MLINHYWSLKSVSHTDDLATTTERIRELLQDTVGRQLVADVPVALIPADLAPWRLFLVWPARFN